MSAAGAARLLAAGAAWRLTGAVPAGRALVGALADGDETERTVAGMQLTRAGDRSVPLLTEALLTGSAPGPLVVDVLASIGTDKARSTLRRVARAPAPGVAVASRESAARALRTLDEIDRRGRP
jgi:hypothetical protein